jgi:DUF3047 family protein
MSRRARIVITIVALLALGASASRVVSIDNWAAYSAGPLNLATVWQFYPFAVGSGAFSHPPAITLDGGRPVLHLMTERDSMRVGRKVGRDLKIDIKDTPWLVWEWKPLVLPDHGDVRDRHLNDQVGRVLVSFKGLKGILYVWDTTAPVGTEVSPDELEVFQRVLIVVHSGRTGLGQWHRERRDIYADYRRVFEEEPRAVNWIGLESHSDDTKTQTSVMFGSIRFEGP